ncbi:MAG TPA: hypothetical protein VMN39_09480 [Longimicrobiaceae bacterium]|nr:hypothetical protein [Longimicrobiaceae bacterium]
MKGTLVLGLLALAWVRPVGAQAPAPGSIQIELGVEPRRVTVGEPFLSVVRVSAPAGVRVEFGAFAGGDSLQSVSDPLTLGDVAGDGAAVAYRLVAWVPETPLSAAVPIRLVEPGGQARIHLVRLRLPAVASVLPAEEAEIEPRPAKGLLPVPGTEPGLPWWYWALALLGALVAAALAIDRLRRRDGGRAEAAVPPREWALRQLETIPVPPTSSADVLALYRRASRILRRYMERVEPRLGTDLTSDEVVRALAAAGGPMADAAELAGILAAADRVKFSGIPAPADDAVAWLGGVRGWIVGYPRSAASDEESPRAA